MCECRYCGCNIPDGHSIATQVAMRISAEETNAACEIAQAPTEPPMRGTI